MEFLDSCIEKCKSINSFKIELKNLLLSEYLHIKYITLYIYKLIPVFTSSSSPFYTCALVFCDIKL